MCPNCHGTKSKNEIPGIVGGGERGGLSRLPPGPSNKGCGEQLVRVNIFAKQSH